MRSVSNDSPAQNRRQKIRRRASSFLESGFPPDDPVMHGQLAEMWAIERWNQLAEETRLAEQGRRRAFVQGQLCAYLASGMTRTDAVVAAGVARSTLYRWLRDERGFREAVMTAERQGGSQRSTTKNHNPIKLGASAHDAILRQLRAGGTRGQAAAAAGVSRQTFYTWFKRFPDFRAAVLAAESAALST